MQTNKKTITDQAISCLQCANTLASSQNRRTINWDDLFWGSYVFIQNTEYFELFCKLFHIPDHQILDQYYHQNYSVNFSQQILKTQKLPFNKKLKSILSQSKDIISKIDLLSLFYISYFNLSSQCNKFLSKHYLPHKTLVHNCQSLLQKPYIKQLGLLAFLEILHKILKESSFKINDIQNMQIQDFSQTKNIQTIYNVVKNETKEPGSWDAKNNTNTTTKKKEIKKMTIEYFGTNLTKEYKDGFLDPIIGRNKEIDQVIYTLLRKSKNNPLLIGEAGVGKTAVVEGLAQRIVKWEVPNKLKNKKIFMLDMWTLVAGTKYRGDFEARMKSILEEATDVTNNIILFIDELHTIIGAGWQDSNDAAQLIKPLLARGKIKLIGATTFDEYQKHIEKDAALKRRFQEVIINEPSTEVTAQILIGLKESYQNFHGVKISDESIHSAIKLSQRYILNRQLPDKAIDIIDEACARKSTMNQKLENDNSFQKNEKQIEQIEKKIEAAINKQDYFKAAELKEKEDTIKKELHKIRTHKNIPIHLRPEITTTDVGQVLSEKIWIPANIVNENEQSKLKRLEADLQTKILGQSEAVNSVVNTLTRSRLSVIDRNKPIGSFLFLWPTWVGKTYLAKLIAKDFFGDKKALIRIDMSEFMEKFSVSKLIGSPAGYVGYDEWWNLTEAVRRQPYSVVLFDEIEKASPEVLNILLQVLDEGRLKDSKWRRIDFKSTIIIMTSNIGSEEFATKKSSIGFETTKWDDIVEKQFKLIKERVLSETKTFLSPEMLNRIDHQIVFRALDKKTLTKIFQQDLQEFLNTRKKNSNIDLPIFSNKQIHKIIDEIYEPQYWARPIHRYIQDKIEQQIIDKIMKK